MQLEEQKELKSDEEDKRAQVAPNMGAGGSHPQAMPDPAENEGEEEAADCEQQRNEEKEEIQRLLRGWRTRETSPIVRWAWADYIDEEHERQEEPEEEIEERKLEAQVCRAGGAAEPRGGGGGAEGKGGEEQDTGGESREELRKQRRRREARGEEKARRARGEEAQRRA